MEIVNAKGEKKSEEVSVENVGGPGRAENPPLGIDIQEISQRDIAFSLDRFFACADTANPDSGERGSARRTQSRLEQVRLTKPTETGQGFKRKNRARSRCFALAFAEQANLL